MARQNQGNRQDRFESETNAERYGSKDKDEGVSFSIRMLMSFLSIAPCICLGFYAVGWWQVKLGQLDNLDNSMLSFAIMCGLMNYFIINLFLKKRWG